MNEIMGSVQHSQKATECHKHLSKSREYVMEKCCDKDNNAKETSLKNQYIMAF